ncbi:MFS general substrate transporter [Rickenella mellea]|uniref:MFS general substrate transporter n=1 Tax=Rickenella mellea TaxID=50990 RepID=A0A4Y7QJL8_9AGAM|nr:MFS general substrate transporter [Rickenella mellea]
MSPVHTFVNEVANEVAHAHDETRPLLHDREAHPLTHSAPPTPLPRTQLTTLCAIRLADPIAFTQIFPYVNQMMENFGVATNPSQVGFYSGLVESLFALAQLMSIYQWARLSGKFTHEIGRRPVVFAGTIGIGLTTILFGFSKTLLGVLCARFLAGLFSGNVAVMHSVLGELTDSTNQATAFPIYGLCWPLGIIIGPLIGGTFASPSTKFPRWFNTELFRTFPYLLPCLVSAILAFLSVIVGYYYLDEVYYSISYGATTHNDDILRDEHPHTARSLLRIPVIRSLCASGCALSFIGTAFDVVFVLFCYSPVRTGGLAYSSSQIGYALAVAGASSAAIQLFLMPPLLRTFNSARLYKFCMAIWPYAFLVLPVLNLLARANLEDAGVGTGEVVNTRVNAFLWIGIGCALAMSRVACLAYSLNMILVKEYAPSSSSLGTANGLAQFAQCLARAISPAFVSSLFAYSVDNCILGGHLWVILMVALSFLTWTLSASVPEAPDASTINKPTPTFHDI